MFHLVLFAKEELHCDLIVGVEIKDSAERIEDFLTRKNIKQNPIRVAFMFGEEGHGMIPAHCALCDCFVYIPQYLGSTASLNVACSASIIFYEFAKASGYKEQHRRGEKFVLDEVNVEVLKKKVIDKSTKQEEEEVELGESFLEIVEEEEE